MGEAELKQRLGCRVFDTAPCLVHAIDSSLAIVLINPAFERTFGQRTGDPCHRVLKGRDEPCEICPPRRVFDTGEQQTFEDRGVTAAGEEITYRVWSVPILDSAGAVELVLQITEDLSTQRQLQRELAQAERLASVGFTTAGLAHTIKNILAGLEGGIYVINSGFDQENDERVRGGWAMVQSYIAQVSTLVRNLLSYAKDQPPRRERVEPAELVDRVIRLYDDKAALVGIELRRDVAEGLPTLVGDPEMLHACLTNLVSNAMDACCWDPDADKQHRITVSAQPRPKAAGGVIFEVTDTGMGIPLEHQHKILRAHYTSKGMRGTGLGLLLTQKTVGDHQGEIGFSTEPGSGSTFYIELPGQRVPADSKETPDE
jgi:signal transduction histidine kinase